MRTLFIDLASHEKIFALIEGDLVKACVPVPEKTPESGLMPILENMCLEAGTSLKDINRIASIIGPGGFMSLRVATAFANALSFGLGVPLAGIHLSDLWHARIPPLPPTPSPEGRRGAPQKENLATLSKYATNPYILTFARRMRKEPTPAESILWEKLKNRSIGYKFRRQHPIQSRILDFYCDEVKLGIEIDGEYHESKEQNIYDMDRTEAVGNYNIKILRFRNEEVIRDEKYVVQKILETCQREAVKARVSPLPSGEGSGERVLIYLWLHSTKKELLFIRGFGEFAQEWPEPVLIATEKFGEWLTANSLQLSFIGELIPEHRVLFPMLTPLQNILPVTEALLGTLKDLQYEKMSLEPWYGRGA